MGIWELTVVLCHAYVSMLLINHREKEIKDRYFLLSLCWNIINSPGKIHLGYPSNFLNFTWWHFLGLASPLAAACSDSSCCWGSSRCRLAESLKPFMRPQGHSTTSQKSEQRNGIFPQATKHESQTFSVASLKADKEFLGAPCSAQLLTAHPCLLWRMWGALFLETKPLCGAGVEWAEHTHTHLEQDCRTVVLSGNQAKWGFASSRKLLLWLPAVLVLCTFPPHQDPLPSSILFFLFSFYILASISASWSDVYSSNECRSHVAGGRYWPSCHHSAAVPQPDKPSCSAGSLAAWHWCFALLWLCGVLFLL